MIKNISLIIFLNFVFLQEQLHGAQKKAEPSKTPISVAASMVVVNPTDAAKVWEQESKRKRALSLINQIASQQMTFMRIMVTETQVANPRKEGVEANALIAARKAFIKSKLARCGVLDPDEKYVDSILAKVTLLDEHDDFIARNLASIAATKMKLKSAGLLSSL